MWIHFLYIQHFCGDSRDAGGSYIVMSLLRMRAGARAYVQPAVISASFADTFSLRCV